MRTFLSDTQAVTGTSATLFEFVQQGPQAPLITIHNTGSITMNYSFQENDGSGWSTVGSASTLTADQKKRLQVESEFPRVRMLGDASGGTTLAFSVTRTYTRPSGGAIPLIAL